MTFNFHRSDKNESNFNNIDEDTARVFNKSSDSSLILFLVTNYQVHSEELSNAYSKVSSLSETQGTSNG